MSNAITIARPYAQAAFEEAQKQNALKAWSELLLGLADVVQNADVQAVVSNPKVPKTKAADLMEAFAGTTANAQQRNFVRVLADNRSISKC